MAIRIESHLMGFCPVGKLRKYLSESSVIDKRLHTPNHVKVISDLFLYFVIFTVQWLCFSQQLASQVCILEINFVSVYQIIEAKLSTSERKLVHSIPISCSCQILC